MSALLEAKDLRVDTREASALAGFGATMDGDHGVLVGAPGALFLAAAGLLPPASGTLRVAGTEPVQGLRERLLAGAPLDPPLPPRLSPRKYVEYSAAIAGLDTRAAAAAADRALSALQMAAVADKPIGSTVAHARRATVVAAALATGCQTLVLEDPTAGLPDDAAQVFADTLLGATAQCRTLLVVGQGRLDSALGRRATSAITFASGRMLAQGSPQDLASQSSVVQARVVGDKEPLTQALVDLGLSPSWTNDTLCLDLGERSTLDLMRAAEANNCVITELRRVSTAWV